MGVGRGETSESTDWARSEPLRGRCGIVTGGSHGIGQVIAARLARLGADIGLNYWTNTTTAETVAREIRTLGRRCVLLKADVGSQSDVA